MIAHLAPHKEAAVIEIDVKECTRVNLQLQTQVNGLNREIHQLGRVLFNQDGQDLLDHWLSQVHQKAHKQIASEPALEVAL